MLLVVLSSFLYSSAYCAAKDLLVPIDNDALFFLFLLILLSLLRLVFLLVFSLRRAKIESLCSKRFVLFFFATAIAQFLLSSWSSLFFATDSESTLKSQLTFFILVKDRSITDLNLGVRVLQFFAPDSVKYRKYAIL